MRTRWLWFSAALSSVLACGSDPYQPPGTGPDADPNAPDARQVDAVPIDAPVDADPNAPDAATVDLPPRLEAVSPVAGAMVAGVRAFSFRVIDENVATTIVAATIGGQPIPLLGTGDIRTGTFDTRDLAGLVFPNILVRAEDEAGQEAQLGFVVALDNNPPAVGMDPPQVRETQLVDGLLTCSRAFDPVGPDAPNDGQTIAQLSEFRARVEDRSNLGTTSSDVFVPYAGVADSAVRLYALDDTTRPLIVDTNGDGVCDAINPEIVATTVPAAANEAALVQLVPVPASGEADFQLGRMGAVAGSNLDCSEGDATEFPEDLCFSADGMTRIIETPVSKLPQLYVIPPVVADFTCAGYGFDAVASNLADGWACVAVEAIDNLGNVNVSPVLRVCIDADLNQVECGALGSIAAAGARPNCTGTFAGGVTNATPCTMPTTFASSGVVGDYELISLD